MRPKISVITPTRNREKTLNRVFKSLSNQNYKDFEWLVCDDASTDSTLKLLKKYKKIAKFKIRIFAFNKRAGKPTIDNYCLKRAKGDFIVFADSDDSFKNNSFDNFIKEWNKIPNKFKVITFAIISRCLGSDGKPLEPKLNLKVKSISYEDLIYKQKKDKEKWLFINKKILKKFKFPEIDYYVPEGLTWIKVSKKYKLWILDNCYRIFYSDTTNSITHSSKINYPIGQINALEFFIKSKLKKKENNFYKLLINFYRFKFINNIFFKYKLTNKIKTKKTFTFSAVTIGFLLFVKDLIFLNIRNEKFYKNKHEPIEIK